MHHHAGKATSNPATAWFQCPFSASIVPKQADSGTKCPMIGRSMKVRMQSNLCSGFRMCSLDTCAKPYFGATFVQSFIGLVGGGCMHGLRLGRAGRHPSRRFTSAAWQMAMERRCLWIAGSRSTAAKTITHPQRAWNGMAHGGDQTFVR